MTQGKLKIHTDNLLPIIKKWLYSEKDIFVRELVSNSCDAISKLKTLSIEEKFDFDSSKMRIDVTIDKEAKTLTFADTGLGMNSDEVEKYIAQLAFSGAEEFAKKYKSDSEKDQMIGHFGLGFYSSYMVSKNVQIKTLSYREGSEGVLWECDGSTDYTIEKSDKTTVGTEITLFVDDENSEFLDETKLRTILSKYCSFLPYPVYLNESQINEDEPLWMKPASECTDEEYIAFYKKLYPFEPDPVFWVHINVDVPFSVKGILYFPKITNRFDWTKNKMQLFCNRVFVSEDCKELIPEFLTSMRGALDSPDIPLNVSRSYLQMDGTVRKLGAHISKKIADRLGSLYRSEKEKFTSIWKDVEMIIKLGVLQDDKFYDRSKNYLVWENTDGEWTTAEEYLERNGDKTENTVFYTTEGKHQSHVLDLYTEKGIEVVIANGHMDAGVMNQLESKIDKCSFKRIDGGAHDLVTDDEEKDEGLVKTLIDFFKGKLSHENVDIEAKPLSNTSCPAMIVMDEQMRRMRDYMMLSGQELPAAMGGKKTLVLNTKNKLINSISAMEDEKLAKEMVDHIYDLSLLSQKEMRPEQMAQFVARSGKVLEKLVSGKDDVKA